MQTNKIEFKKFYRSKPHKVERRRKARLKQRIVWKTLTAK